MAISEGDRGLRSTMSGSDCCDSIVVAGDSFWFGCDWLELLAGAAYGSAAATVLADCWGEVAEWIWLSSVGRQVRGGSFVGRLLLGHHVERKRVASRAAVAPREGHLRGHQDGGHSAKGHGGEDRFGYERDVHGMEFLEGDVGRRGWFAG